MFIYLDLETRPCDDHSLVDEIISSVKHPAKMKRHDTISEWDRTERPDAEREAIAKTSLDGTYGRICVAAWAVDDEEPQAIVSADERGLLRSLMDEFKHLIETKDGKPPIVTWVGHNIAGFDFPFLRKRCIVHSIRPPMQLESALRAKAWADQIADTMLMWDTDRDRRISLDKLCRILGIPSPKAKGMDGSQVAELFYGERYQELGDYCIGDIEATRRCYKALTFVR